MESKPARETVETRLESRSMSSIDRLCRSFGVDVRFADHVLGDLAQEYDERASSSGTLVARAWYVGEIVRSVPHLIWNAVRHGSPAQRARLAACVGGFATVLSLTAVVLLTLPGPPARLLADNGDRRLVINNLRPMQLSVAVFDEDGRKLPSDSVRYATESSPVLSVSPAGAVTCLSRGDANINASLGTISTTVAVRCLPVRQIESSTWISLMIGEPPRHLPFKAIGIDGQPVTELRGSATMSDGAVATIIGGDVVPRAVGATNVKMIIGDRTTEIRVVVHERVERLDNIRDDQRFVAVPVDLPRGATAEFALPMGAFWIKYVPRRAGDAPPTIVMQGRVLCGAGDGLRDYFIPPDEHGTQYCIHSDAAPASVRLSHGHVGAAVVEGWLAFERADR